MVKFSVWLVSPYAHVFILLSIVIDTFPGKCHHFIYYKHRTHDTRAPKTKC